MTATVIGGPALPQVRRVHTDVPGPRSVELAHRRSAALPAGLTSAAGVYVAAAGGGVILDVDGNSFIDLGSGIAVTTVGNAAPAVVAARRRSSPSTPTPASWPPRTSPTSRSRRN